MVSILSLIKVAIGHFKREETTHCIILISTYSPGSSIMRVDMPRCFVAAVLNCHEDTQIPLVAQLMRNLVWEWRGGMPLL